ncbi:hypothetical protein EZS27_029824, partial [termite gut metagenome]
MLKCYKIVFVAVCLISTGQVNAQFIKNTKKETVINWQNQPPKDGIYGADIYKAYDLLKDRKSKKVTVALIGSGIDVEHEDLKGSIRQNPKEKMNGIDDDKNGKIDDIYGWNYLGNAQGNVEEQLLSFADREFLRLKDKNDYYKLQFDGKKYYKVSDNSLELQEVPAPENLAEYTYYQHVRTKSNLGRIYSGRELMKTVRIYARRIDQELKEKFPDKETITHEDFISHIKLDETDSLRMVSMALINPAFMIQQNAAWGTVLTYLETTHVNSLENDYQRATAKIKSDDRKLIGDNPHDIADTKYGNHILLTENAGKGTLYAGIIGAQRSNNTGIDGIADNVQIMTLRVEPSEGEPYPKDIALA